MRACVHVCLCVCVFPGQLKRLGSRCHTVVVPTKYLHPALPSKLSSHAHPMSESNDRGLITRAHKHLLSHAEAAHRVGGTRVVEWRGFNNLIWRSTVRPKGLADELARFVLTPLFDGHSLQPELGRQSRPALQYIKHTITETKTLCNHKCYLMETKSHLHYLLFIS